MIDEEVNMDSLAGKGGKSDHPSVVYGSTGNLPWAVGFRGGCGISACRRRRCCWWCCSGSSPALPRRLLPSAPLARSFVLPLPLFLILLPLISFSPLAFSSSTF